MFANVFSLKVNNYSKKYVVDTKWIPSNIKMCGNNFIEFDLDLKSRQKYQPLGKNKMLFRQRFLTR